MTMLTEKIQAQQNAAAVANQTSERATAIRDLQAALLQLEKSAPALNKACAEAEDQCRAVRARAAQTVEDAENAIRDAHRARVTTARPLEAQVEQLRNRIERDLCHPAVRDAIETVHQIREQARLRFDNDPGQATRATEWCARASVALRDLRYSASPDIAAEVATLMSAQP